MIPFMHKPLPDNLAEGYIRANRYYPQLDAGLNIGAGAIAASMILGHKLRVNDLPRLRATRHQVDKSVAEFEALHSAFRDLPCKMSEKPEANNPHAVTRQRLGTLASGWVPGFTRTAAQFASEALPELPALPPRTEYTLPNPAYPKAERRAARTLLTPDRKGNFSPAAVAFGGVYQAASATLYSREALGEASRYRCNLARSYSPDTTLEQWKGLADDVQTFGGSLQVIVRAGLEAARPEIEEESGFALADATLTAFVTGAIAAYVDRPTPPPHIHAAMLRA
jgi:hypothetical protein